MLKVKGKLVVEEEREQMLNNYKKYITAYDYDVIVDRINQFVDKNGDKVFRSIDLLNELREAEEYKPFIKACMDAGSEPRETGKFFGAAFFDVLFKRKDATWKAVHEPECVVYKKVPKDEELDF